MGVGVSFFVFFESLFWCLFLIYIYLFLLTKEKKKVKIVFRVKFSWFESGSAHGEEKLDNNLKKCKLYFKFDFRLEDSLF